MDDFNAHLQNQREWDRRALDSDDRYSKVATPAEIANPFPSIDPNGWLELPAREMSVLCLCSGGGRHAIQWAATGANVTVVDISGKMLELDRIMAERYGLKVRIIQTSMDQLGALDDESFDLVTQPVSLCYTPRIQETYNEVSRVLKVGGLYFNQQKQPVTLQVEARPTGTAQGYQITVPYDHHGPLPAVDSTVRGHREAGTVEYLHTWSALIGGMCKAGLAIEAFAEPDHANPKARPGEFGHRARYAAPFFRVKARKVKSQNGEISQENSRKPVSIWIPGQ